MTPQRCIVPLGGREEGDCWRACVASILDLPIRDVPNFSDMAPTYDEMIEKTRTWLAARGLTLFCTWISANWELDKVLHEFSSLENQGVPIILGGRCRADLNDNHAVVVMDGRIVHDPSGAGISGPCLNDTGKEGWWWLYVICVGPNFGARAA